MISKSPCPKMCTIMIINMPIIIICRAKVLSIEKNFVETTSCRKSIKMPKNSESQTENTGLYDPLAKMNAMVQNCDAEKSCYAEKVCSKVLQKYKVISPLFWAEQPQDRKYKTGKFTQTPRNFLFANKFTQTVDSDFVNKNSKVVNFSGKQTIQKRKREEIFENQLPVNNKKICLKNNNSTIPAALLTPPKTPVPNIFDYKPTPIIELEKRKIQQKIETVEAELEKLKFDSELNKFAFQELKKDSQIVNSKIKSAEKLVELISQKTEYIDNLKKKFEQLRISSDLSPNFSSDFEIVELNEESIKDFWPGGL